MKPTPRVLALQKQFFNQYKRNKRSWVEKYGADAEKVMTGAAFKRAESAAMKENKQRIKEMIKKALMGPIKEEEIDSKAFIQSRKSKDNPEDVVKMDVPLLIRMLEYAREDAKTDMDLHDVAERAIEAVKLRGLLSMEDYNDLVGESIEEETGYSKYLATPENPKGKTPGLTPDIMSKILMRIATMGDDDVEETIRLGEGVIYEELCPKGKAYIKKRQAAGEKSSAYLSGRAVKVCKGQMKG